MRTMIATGVACLLTAGAALAQNPAMEQAERPKLREGDRAPQLYISDWVKGQPISSFEPGRTYVVEFWATWCGPCIRGIPHLSELQKEHKDNVTIVGVSLDREQDKVAPFVAKKGDEMNYTVAIQTMQGEGDDAEGLMSKHWMQPALRRGIPCAFVVNDKGTIAWIGHPAEMDEPLEQIVAGNWDIDAHLAVKEQAERAQQRAAIAQAEIDRAIQAKRFDVAVSKLDDLLAIDADQYGTMVARKFNQISWDTLTDGTIENPDKRMALVLATRACDLTGYSDSAILDTLAKAHFDNGDISQAIKWQELSIEKLGPGMDAYRAEFQERLREYRNASM